jgi:hypothetical protein
MTRLALISDRCAYRRKLEPFKVISLHSGLPVQTFSSVLDRRTAVACSSTAKHLGISRRLGPLLATPTSGTCGCRQIAELVQRRCLLRGIGLCVSLDGATLGGTNDGGVLTGMYSRDGHMRSDSITLCSTKWSGENVWCRVSASGWSRPYGSS